jgi:hypothetical protein
MPFLIQLKTDLKSLKYGSDRPGGGWSGQPYVQFPIEDNTTPPTIVEFYTKNRNSLDYPARGGGVTYEVGTQTYTLASQIDKSRIKKFFEDKPRGAAFIQKQIGLQLSNPKMETGKALAGITQGAPLSGLLENTRVYNNGKNTLQQVGVEGTGVHLTRHGTMPFNILEKNYAATVGAQNKFNYSSQNRLLILQKLKMTSSPTQFSNPSSDLDINIVNNLGISLNKNILFQYLGGPGSSYGIGSTTIKRSENTTKVFAQNTMTYDQLMSQNKTSIAPSNIQDFRSQVENPNSPTWDYRKSSLEWRLNTGIPGIERDRSDYTVTIPDGIDQLNALPAFIFQDSVEPWAVQGKDSKDLIKFGFEAISNDNVGYSNAILFRAFLTSITDNNSAELNAFKYMGRGETFRTYQGFDRSISFGFKIAAQSRAELKPLYTKLNQLISQVYPDYSESGYMRAPVIRLTIGDYIYRMPGFLESINVTIDGATSWEINIEESKDVAQLPHSLEVAVSFKPIFDTLPQRSTEINKTALITKSDGSFLGGINTSILDTNNLKRQALSDKILMKVDVNSIKTPIKKIPKPYTPFKTLTTEQLNNNLLGKNKYNAG